MGQLAINGGTPVRTEAFPQWPVFDEKEEKALLSVLRSLKWGTFGPEVERFESSFASYIGTARSLAVCSGTASLEIILRALGIGAGDEVIIPPYTFAATMTAVLICGAVPVFADIDPDTCNIDIGSVEGVIGDKTRAVIPVHFAGLPVDMDRLTEICAKNSLHIIEDAAQAHGSAWRGRRVGGIGTIGSFSFQLTKNISSGEGGAIVSDDTDLIERCWSVHNCGRVREDLWYMHHHLSGNYRMTDFQAAILSVQLERLEDQIDLREKNAALLSEKLSRIPGISLTRMDPGVSRHTRHLFVFMFEEKEFGGISRRRFVEALNAEGIPAIEGYEPLYRQPIFRDGPVSRFISDPERYEKLSLPGTEKTVREALWLPQYTLLGGERELEDIALAVKKIREHRAETA